MRKMNTHRVNVTAKQADMAQLYVIETYGDYAELEHINWDKPNVLIMESAAQAVRTGRMLLEDAGPDGLDILTIGERSAMRALGRKLIAAGGAS
jgi:hypothetical protein